MMEHEAEIFARPARTWFQTNKQKRQSAAAARLAELGAAPEADGVTSGAAKGGKGQKLKKEQERAKRKREDDKQVRKKNNFLMEVTLPPCQRCRHTCKCVCGFPVCPV